MISNMGTSVLRLLLLVTIALTSVDSNFMRFKSGFEYEYKFESVSTIHQVGGFNLKAKISFTNIEEHGDRQELRLKVYTMRFNPLNDPTVQGHDLDLSNWFSFIITSRGEILNVFYPPDEDLYALAVKKGFAALFASKLHQENEVEGHHGSAGWMYDTTELGHEGEHNATYIVVSNYDGKKFTKIRHGHPIKNSKSKSEKTLHFSNELGTIHRVEINEEFTAPKNTTAGFDPYHGMREVKAVSDFTDHPWPDMTTTSKGELTYLTQRHMAHFKERPVFTLAEDTIHVKQSQAPPRKLFHLNYTEALRYIQGNLTCMREQPAKGSEKLNECFTFINLLLKEMSSNDTVRLSLHYFIRMKPVLTKNIEDINAMVDAFGVQGTELAQNILVDRLILGPQPRASLIHRFLLHIVGNDKVPAERVITTLEDIAFHPEKFPKSLFEDDTYHRTLLCLGSVAKKLYKNGDKERAIWITSQLEKMLGVHDPWDYRKKREVLSEQEMQDYDTRTVNLLEALGNAAIEQSFDHIVSHVNSSTNPWIKRAGVHSLRHYAHDKAVHVMLKTALYDEDSVVRYEALLQYQAHPNRKSLSPHEAQHFNSTFGGDFNPYATGIHEVAMHRRRKRSLWDGFEFKLSSPSYDWQKVIGSTSIGASFGLIIKNELDLKISLLSGHMKINVHDEVYARVHLGMLGFNIDIFLARICFKGKAEYNLNILQEFDVEKIEKMAKQFDNLIGNVVGEVKNGVDLFDSVINSDINIGDIAKAFVDALEQLPNKVLDLRFKAAAAVRRLGEIDESELPPFIIPARNFILKVANLFFDIKTDVMDFYNTLMETVQIIIPQSIKTIFNSVKELIDAFKKLFKYPKQAIGDIFKSVMAIRQAVTDLLEAKNKTMKACFFYGEDKPYWWDFRNEYEEITQLASEAFTSLTSGGAKWIQEGIASEDPIAKLTQGKFNMAQVKQDVINEIKDIIDSLKEPFAELLGIADQFMEQYQRIMALIKELKEAYSSLKEGYQKARSMIDRVFGSKCHKEFPREYRVSGGSCSGDGFYPSKLRTPTEYPYDGVDLVMAVGANVVAPFGGVVYRTSDNEVVITPNGGSLQGKEIVISNVAPASSIQSLGNNDYVASQIAAGATIGTASESQCGGAYNHIHFAIKNKKTFLDPTKFLESRIMEIPKWVQYCDDYKLVWKGETIKEGVIVGLGGKKNNNTSPKRSASEPAPLKGLDPAKEPSQDVNAMKADPNSLFSKVKSNPPPQAAPAQKDQSFFGKLLNKPKNFMKSFSIRKIKMGQVVDFLDFLGLDESRQQLAKVLVLFKELTENKSCNAPDQMTDDQLRLELMERSIDNKGSRPELIKKMYQSDNQCPLMKLTLPKQVYCTFDDKCLGLQCCSTIKVFMFRKVIKAYARFDPCDFKLIVGIDSWTKTFALPDIFFGHEADISTGLEIPIFGGMQLRVRYKIEKTETEAVLTFGFGLCAKDDPTRCIGDVYLLKDTIFPLPICHADGSITWPDIDFNSYFSRDAVKKRLLEAAKDTAKNLVVAAVQELLSSLGLPSDLLDPTPPCPRPENMTIAKLTQAMEDRELPLTGSRAEWEQRYRLYDRQCSILGKTITLPEIPGAALAKRLYISIARSCLRIDACIDFRIAVQSLEFIKAFKAYVDVDPCNFVITVGFESWSKSYVLLGNLWGKDFEFVISPSISIKFNLDKDSINKVFLIDFGLKICPGSDCFIDENLITDQEMPIPVCNDAFTLPGGDGSIRGLANMLGGKLTQGGVDLVFKYLGIDKIFIDGQCQLPEAPQGCPWSFDIQTILPDKLKDKVSCVLPQNCFGLHCCVDIEFKLPFADITITKSLPIWFTLEPCDFRIEVGVGTYRHTEQLLHYDFGKLGVLKIGSGDNPPMKINYIIRQLDNSQGFNVDVSLDICLPLDGETVCFPDGGLPILKQTDFPICNARAYQGLTNFSLTSLVADMNLDLKNLLKPLARGAVMYILQRLGVAKYLRDSPCVSSHDPYSPATSGFRNTCPSTIVDMPHLKGPVKCYIPPYCTGIDCCMDIFELDMALNAYLYIDTCDYEIRGGIESWTFKIPMLTYQWGTTITKSINDVIVIKFKADKDDVKKTLTVDLTLSVCFEDDGSCLLSIDVFKNTEIPQPFCNIVGFRNFNVTQFLHDQTLGTLQQLSSEIMYAVFSKLGINRDDMLDPQCNRFGSDYTPAVSNWKNQCYFGNVALPKLHNQVSCSIPDFCTGIKCCMDVPFLRRSFQAYIYIDTCTETISGAFENIKFEHKIFNYEWGKLDSVNVADVLKFDFVIVKLEADKMLRVDMNVSLCIDPDTCPISVTLFDNTLLPQPLCNPNSLKFSNFSLTGFLEDLGESVAGQILPATVDLIFNEFGITEFLQTTPCQRTNSLYVPSTLGWKSDCPKTVNFPDLSGLDASCSVPDYCTGLDCCLEVPRLQKSFHAWALINACNRTLDVGVESIRYYISLDGYPWGVEKEVSIAGVFSLFYRIEDLSVDKYRLNIRLALCLNKGNCLAEVVILNNVEVPKVGCDWSLEYRIPNFSFADFKDQLKLSITENLLPNAADILFKSLGIYDYLRTPQCSHQQKPFANAIGGWRSDCPLHVDFPSLPDAFSCHVPSFCTGVDCCIEVPEISRSFRAWALIDGCNRVLRLGIENYMYNLTFDLLDMGVWNQFYLGNVVRIDYKIIDLGPDEKKYLVNVKLGVCVESIGACLKETILLQDVKLPKILCDWTLDFKDPNFSLTSVLASNGVPDLASLAQDRFDDLMVATGLDALFSANQCNRNVFPYFPSTLGWNNECSKPGFTPPSLSGLPVSCHMLDFCTGIDCCVDITMLRRTVRAWVYVDGCNNKMSVGIETLQINVSLNSDTSYTSGEWQHVYLNGIIRMDFRLLDMSPLDEYKFDLTVRGCFEANDDACPVAVPILTATRIPKLFCDWSQGFHIPDFALKDFMIERGLTLSQSLSDVLVDQLLVALNIKDKMLDVPCHGDVSKFTPGWDNNCPVQLALPPISNTMRCSIPDYCTGLDCCVYIRRIRRSVRAYAMLNTCNYTLDFGIEKEQHSIPLFTYQWGTEETVNIGGMTQLGFTITNDPIRKKFTINLNLKVCFSTLAPCDLVVPVFTDTELPMLACDPTAPSIFKGVSFDLWNVNECSSFTGSQSCAVNLPTLAQSICSLSSDCMEITCCKELDFIVAQRKISVSFRIDHCANEIVYAIENKRWTKTPLISFPFDVEQVETIGDAFTLTYTISDTATAYMVDLTLKKCYYDIHNGQEICEIDQLLDQSRFVIPVCGGQGKRRKKRATPPPFIPDIGPFIRNMQQNGASNAEIQAAMDKLRQESTDSRDGFQDSFFNPGDDSTVGTRSVVKSLGSSNPGNLAFGNTNKLSVTITGSSKILAMLGLTDDVAGREDSAFVIGKGLSRKGLELLGERIADMSIGDMEGMLDMKNIDPIVAAQLLKEIRDLARVLYAEIAEAIASGALFNEFSSFDITLQGDFSFPRRQVIIFEYSVFMMVGPVPLTIGFGAGGFFGLDLIVGAKILGMTAFGTATPYAGLTVYGFAAVGFLLYGELKLVGYLMETRFPTTAEVGFKQFPLDVSMYMDLELVPLRLRLMALVTLKINLVFTSFTKVLLKINIWEYVTPSIRKRMISYSNKEKDDSPPQFTDASDSTNARGRRAVGRTGKCEVEQLADRDYTEPAFRISVRATDDKSQVRFFLDVGTTPGANDVIHNQELGGATTVAAQSLAPTGQRLHFTVYGENSGGGRAKVICEIPSYDVTLPDGRFDAEYKTSSNPNMMRASVVANEDSPLVESLAGIGYGKNIYGEQVVRFYPINLEQRQTTAPTVADPLGVFALEQFTGYKEGRLVGPIFKTFNDIQFPAACAQKCLQYHEDKCLSINYDYGVTGKCELIEAIEGHQYKRAASGKYGHYERKGIGHAYEFVHDNLQLKHNVLYFFNLHMRNYLNYTNVISTEGILVDFTPPDPGPMNITSDTQELLPCAKIIPDDRPEWEKVRCIGTGSRTVMNHRTLIDGAGSMTIFNGHIPLEDKLYTRANKYIDANWDGIHDNETGLLGFSLTVGRKVCEELIHPHHDPQKHLFHKDEWTYSGIIHPIPEPYAKLEDGKYFITVRALNDVEYGGPLATTFCHSTPLSIDNSPPLVHDIYNITYDEVTFLIQAAVNLTDPESNIREMDICLGKSRRDCILFDWNRYPYGGKIEHTYEVDAGVPAWLKVRAINNVDLRTIEVAKQPILVDATPPIAGSVYDGSIYKHDLLFTKDMDKICANWENFHDPESGIAYYNVGVGSASKKTDVANLTRFEHSVHEACITLPEEKYLVHGNIYYVVVWAYNGGHKRLNVSGVSNGVIVDLTPPVEGEIIDGVKIGFSDIEFSAAAATVSAKWRNYLDPESKLDSFHLLIMRAADLGTTYEVIHPWETVSNTTTIAIWHHFHLKHKDRVKTILKTTNGAQKSITTETDGFIVDLTPPTLLYLGDGLTARADIDFQASKTTLTANFDFEDLESGVDHFKFIIFEMFQGTKQQVFPDGNGAWTNIMDNSIKTYTETRMLELKAGAQYSIRVAAVNRAGFVATYDTNGIIVDYTAPTMQWVYVGVFSGDVEEKVDNYVWQADTEGIKANWFATDGESGIASYLVAIGTSSGATDILDWTDMGEDRNRYINDLTLAITNIATKLPVYYVSAKAVNGAGQESLVVTSTPIVVTAADKEGVAIDGADGTDVVPHTGLGVDIDFQKDTSTVTVQFEGFESQLHGIVKFEMAVGTTPRGEDIRPYMSAGVIHREEVSVAGNGVASSGTVTDNLPLKQGMTYYASIRAITNIGNVLDSVTDGFTVDTSSPKVKMMSLGLESRVSQGDVIYQTSTDSLPANWEYIDNESVITNAWVSVGTYPHGDDVWSLHEQTVTSVLQNSLPVPDAKPDITGKPNIVTVTVTNAAGLTGYLVSKPVVVDITQPLAGEVNCPAAVRSVNELECDWRAFRDPESPIVTYKFAIGTKEGLDDVFSFVELSDLKESYVAKGLSASLQHNAVYYATVVAINAVGLQIEAYSNAISIDHTPPEYGAVVELSSVYYIDVTNDTATDLMNRQTCTSTEDCMTLDVTCQESLTDVRIAWEPFRDLETGIEEYQIAIGTTPGGGQIKPFFVVPKDKTHYTVTGLDLMDLRQIFVAVKATNGAGHVSVAVSNGVYMSYLSQGLPPLKHIGIWESQAKDGGDIEFQTVTNTLSGGWDVSGDPCPVKKYEWAIKRIDGLEVQPYLDSEGRTYGVADGLSLNSKEQYYMLLRVTNAGGYSYVLRSNGVSIHIDPLVPGKVRDGDTFGFDQNFQPSRSRISANWNGFGEPRQNELRVVSGNPGVQVKDKNQAIEYYEVAVGTDRRFPKTRDNIVPFTSVGTNTSVTFYDLDLVQGTALYYFTVRAYSMSNDRAQVTSNGFYVGYDGGVSGGEIIMPAFISSESAADVQWVGFMSRVDILLYHVAISDNQNPENISCDIFVDARNTEELKLFNIYALTNVGKDTVASLTSLVMMSGNRYYAWAIATDQAGECKMVSHSFIVDITPPSGGRLKAGPYFNMLVSYTADQTSILATWDPYSDAESDIKTYRLSLWSSLTCKSTANNEELVVDWISLKKTYVAYNLIDLTLQPDKPYYLHMEITNRAGLKTNVVSPPILFDTTSPTAGHVIDGTDIKSDEVWSKSTSSVSGTILHLPSPLGDACPARKIPIQGSGWKTVRGRGFLDPTSHSMKLQYRPGDCFFTDDGTTLAIQMSRDTKEDQMYSGGYYRTADLMKDGDYEISVKAAGLDNSVTGIVFWDGEDGAIADYNYVPEPDWTLNTCSCCLVTPVVEPCPCNCTEFLTERNLTASVQQVTTDLPAMASAANPVAPWSVQGDQTNRIGPVVVRPPVVLAQRACGLQLHSGVDSYAVIWCRYFNNSRRARRSEVPLSFNPSLQFHNYKLNFVIKKDDALFASVCLEVFADGQFLANLCEIPQFTTSTKLMFHVWNRDNFVAPLSRNQDKIFDVWKTVAAFREVLLPPHIGAICRFAVPFRGGQNAIVRYEAGIGTAPGDVDVVAFQEVHTPCVPCIEPCDSYNCQVTCAENKIEEVTLTLNNLQLATHTMVTDEKGVQESKQVTYYLIVKAVLGSGMFAMASSDGFSVDDTPPVFNETLLLFMDTRLGDMRPVETLGSETTIKVVWTCDDFESSIEENLWAIGTTVGGEEIQPFTSTGLFPIGSNDQLKGILQNHGRYYVSIRCRNGAGATTEFQHTAGIEVLLETPDISNATATIENADPIASNVIPSDAMKTTDHDKISVQIDVVDDPAVNRYDLCMKSSRRPGMYDVFPCTWVSQDRPSLVELVQGALFVDGIKLIDISELKAPTIGGDNTLPAQSTFNMEPGKSIFVIVRYCNAAERCAQKEVAVIVISKADTISQTSSNGEPILLSSDGSPRGRKKRSTSGITVETPGGMTSGQTLMYNTLNQTDLEADYRSDASVDFIPYIVNPTYTIDQVSRALYNRIKVLHQHFSVLSVGQLPMPGPLAISFSFDPANITENDTVVLLHWNPIAQNWQLSSDTCYHVMTRDSIDLLTGSYSVQVCDTWFEKSATARRKRATNPADFFYRETQFATAIIDKRIFNDPPYLLSQTDVIMDEDSGTLIYQLEANDTDGDVVLFRMDPNSRHMLGTAELTTDGIFTYKPCQDCNGLDRVMIILDEEPVPGVPVATSSVTLDITISPVNDPPQVFVGRSGYSLVPTVANKTIVIAVQPNVANNILFSDIQAVFGAYDVDVGDQLTFYVSLPSNGNLTLSVNSTAVPTDLNNCPTVMQEAMLPCIDFTLPHAADKLAWIYTDMAYVADEGYHGYDPMMVYLQDAEGKLSDVITIVLAVMEYPCMNNATCTSAPNGPTCEDPVRAEGFDKNFYCTCDSGWTGRHCTVDLDECASNPCHWPYVCYDLQNKYKCACPIDHPDCEVLPDWVIALITVGVVLVVVILVVLTCIYMIYQGRLGWITQHKLGWKYRTSKDDVKNINKGFIDEQEDENELEPSHLNPSLFDTAGGSGTGVASNEDFVIPRPAVTPVMGKKSTAVGFINKSFDPGEMSPLAKASPRSQPGSSHPPNLDATNF